MSPEIELLPPAFQFKNAASLMSNPKLFLFFHQIGSFAYLVVSIDDKRKGFTILRVSTTNLFFILIVKDLGDFQKSLTYRKAQLDSLEKLCSSSEVENNLPLSDEQEEFMSSLKHKYPDWAECIKQAKLLAKDDEFITDLFYIGQKTELPHHLSKKSEIRTLLCKTETSLKLLKSTPVAITIARSEYDEYSTQKTLDFVHCELVCMMRRLYRIPSEIGCPKL